VIRSTTSTDHEAILALNQAEVEATSPLDGTKLAALAAQAAYLGAFVAESHLAAFVIDWAGTARPSRCW
jgi:predicted GNAT superfamily acetyltransferase